MVAWSRGRVVAGYETSRLWCRKVGPVFAARWRRRRSRPGDAGHADAVVLKIDGQRHHAAGGGTLTIPESSPVHTGVPT